MTTTQIALTGLAGSVWIIWLVLHFCCDPLDIRPNTSRIDDILDADRKRAAQRAALASSPRRPSWVEREEAARPTSLRVTAGRAAPSERSNASLGDAASTARPARVPLGSR